MTLTLDPVATFERARSGMVRERRRRSGLFAAAFLLAVVVSGWVGEVNLTNLATGIPGALGYIAATLPSLRLGSLGADLADWFWALDRWLLLLVDTIVIGFLATVMGTAAAFLLSFAAARNLSPNRTLCFVTRRVLEIARSVPELVYAMIFVFAFGLGPLAGVMAIALHTAGALGKLFSEVNENADLRPLDGTLAAGADWFQGMRYAIVPQVLPNFASYTLLRFEINVRSATVIGFVGAGGIGQELMFVIRQFVYQDISAIVLLIILLVCIIDVTCERIRHNFARPGAT